MCLHLTNVLWQKKQRTTHSFQVEHCKQLYLDIPYYCKWVLAWDYYINEEKNEDEDEDDKKKREVTPYQHLA